jgi:multicomponent Na+:H+ antiporter subunit D
MTSWLVVLPIAVPMATAMVAFALRHHARAVRGASLAGAAALLACAVWLIAAVWDGSFVVAQMGGWAAPFGITLVADLFSAVMVLITAITGLAVAVYALADIDSGRERYGFHPLFHVLLSGVCGAFVTGDVFNLYVWFEVMLIASFALLVLGGERAQIDGTVKYVAVNLLSTILFLSAIGLLYGLTGTLNMAELHVRVQTLDDPGLLSVVAVLFLIGFGIKAAVFPLFFWLPASYHTPPVAIAAVFSALLTKVGVYALIRMFSLVFVEDVGFTHQILLVVAALTMIVGVLGAAAQNEVRRILSFHIVSQIGYMILGLALFTPLAMMGAVFYLVHHIIVKANLFLIGGIAHRLGGSFELKSLGGLYRSHPWLAALFLIPALSLAGLPPLSGFWAKLVLIQASLEVEEYLIVAITLVVGLLTLFSMMKIWMQAFWKPAPEAATASATATAGKPPSLRPVAGGAGSAVAPLRAGELALLAAPVVALAAMTVVIGLYTEPFAAFATRAAEQLLAPEAYVRAVLEVRQ